MIFSYFFLTLLPWFLLDEHDVFFNHYLKLPLVGLLCVLVFLPLMRVDKLRCGLFEFWGRNSLQIYLWHVIPILILKTFLSGHQTYYYLSAFLLMVLGVLVTYFELSKRKRYENNSFYPGEGGK